jgi:4-hydroxy-3-methylbut-2-enyl diphosphate reductase
LDRELRPGDVVVATEVHGGDGQPVPVPSAALLAGALTRLGLRVRVGPVRSTPRLVDGPERARLRDTGALAVDMESAQLATLAADRPFAVLRAMVDTPGQPLRRLATAGHGIAALRALRRSRPALDQWAAATGPREILLAVPERDGDNSCATTDRELAVQAVAKESDLVLVAGSGEDSDSRRLVEVAGREGGPAHPVGDASEVDLRWLAGTRRIGITAGAAAPPGLVDALVRSLSGLGSVTVRECAVVERDIRFTVSRR